MSALWSIHSIALKQDASKVEAVEASHLAKSIPGCRSLHDDIRSGVQIRRNMLGSNLSMLDHGGLASLSAASCCVVLRRAASRCVALRRAAS
ncbi:hypothetical protein L1887_54936 [Cichorium endivia]|nr:hypothetical protein L1887_54936 [Cichorium endivia]